jgi:hypothetical protein
MENWQWGDFSAVLNHHRQQELFSDTLDKPTKVKQREREGVDSLIKA